jgi:hypothetical protein
MNLRASQPKGHGLNLVVSPLTALIENPVEALQFRVVRVPERISGAAPAVSLGVTANILCKPASDAAEVNKPLQRDCALGGDRSRWLGFCEY